MKFIAITTLMLVFASCATNVPPTPEANEIKAVEEAAPQYMTKEEVMAEFANPQPEIKASYDDPGYVERVSNLIPLEELFKIPAELKKSGVMKAVAAPTVVDVATLPMDVDLRKQATSVKSQGQEGSCSSFGITAAQEATHCAKNASCGLDLSERGRWVKYGSQYSALAAIRSIVYPISAEKFCPYSSKTCPPNVKNYEGYNIDQMTRTFTKLEVLAALASGKHVYFWSQVPKEMAACKKTISSGSMSDGGHAYAVMGYFDKNDPTLIVKQSWGKNCADSGIQYMKFSVFDVNGYWGAASVDATSITPGTPDGDANCETKCVWKRKAIHFWEKREYCTTSCR